ncbi:MAG TPA: hypothetical protein VK629_16790 [Steroidobacteraceae bacterium]|nr:hypothetical protein [Steroidobacteraceae bacterium]
MKLTRLRLRSNQLPIIEVEEEFLLASTVLAHIERLRQVRVLTKKCWILSDSFEAHFDYRGQRFVMEMPFGCITVTALDPATSIERIEELATHIDNYRTVWPTRGLWAIVRYFFLPLETAERAVELERPDLEVTRPQRTESKRVSTAP